LKLELNSLERRRSRGRTTIEVVLRDDLGDQTHPPAFQIGAVVFDLGGVVADFRPEERLEAFAAATGFAPEEIRSRLFESGFDAASDRGEYSLAQAYAAGIALLDNRITEHDFAACYCTAFAPNDDILDLAGALPVRTALLTNNGPILLDQLPRRFARLIRTFDPVVFSCEAGATKPDPRPYRYAAERLGMAPAQVLFIDDTTRNIDGAIRAGMQAVLFKGIEALKPELEQRGLL
jgi:HAD superfamily hydrolase (TIGR01509 family)